MSKSDFDWLKNRISILHRYTDELAEIEKDVYNPASYWTALKIIALSYFSGTYSKIISNKPWIKKMYYIDIFSGSGLCQLDGEDIVLGSPLAVADSTWRNPFDKMFLIDKDSTKANALEKRLSYLKNEVIKLKDINYETFPEDCNKCIPKIIGEIKENSEKEGDFHCLVFIDPYGMEIDWPTVEALLQIPSDIILTLQSFQIGIRTVGKAKGNEATRKRFNRFLGREVEILDLNPHRILEEYKENLKKFRKIAIDCTIKGRRNEAYYYDWIIATKETRGGSPWIKTAKEAKRRIENLNGSLVKQALRQLQGKDSSLQSFITETNAEKQQSITKWFK